ncbi:MAG TPA: beta-aspartyl-peptidase [Rectinemataceae bacterium]|nr:beta-aspartyl-peptidase [Rectinemataceae bacterium]
MFLLIKDAELYAPGYMGKRDILVAGHLIAAVAERIDPAGLPAACRILDAGGHRVVPGLVDGHVHIIGGGGEGGFRTRTPELGFLDASLAGVTTVVGVLGTDGVARSLEALVAKVYALREEGLSAWCFTGSYAIPVKTLTGEAARDIMLVEPVIGIGEIAVSDHRSSRPTMEEIARVAAQARVGGMLSGKAGLVNVHIGDAPAGLSLLEAIVSAGDIPRSQFLPTHCNRNPRVLEQAMSWARAGGRVDFTTSGAACQPHDGDTSAAGALARLREDGIPLERSTMSSDGQGSLPRFDSEGRLSGLTVGSCSSLIDAVREATGSFGLPFSEVLATVTSNPATALGLAGKGRIEPGMDADLAILDDETRVFSVVARGRILVEAGRALVKGTFDGDDSA